MKWLNLLQPRPDDWFSKDQIEALRAIRAGEVNRTKVVNELLEEGYSPVIAAVWWDGRLPGDEAVLWHFEGELMNAIWPEPVARALWDKGRAFGPDDADALIRFLEIDPYFFRSGYFKPVAIQRLRYCPLTDSQRQRIFGVLRAVVLSGWDRNVKDWRKLARFCDPEAVRKLVVEALESERDPVVKKGVILGVFVLGNSRLVGWVNSRVAYMFWDEATELVRREFGQTP